MDDMMREIHDAICGMFEVQEWKQKFHDKWNFITDIKTV